MEGFRGELPPPCTEVPESLRHRNKRSLTDLDIFGHRALDAKVWDQHNALFRIFNQMNDHTFSLTEQERKRRHQPSPSPTPPPQSSLLPHIPNKRKRLAQNIEEDERDKVPSTNACKRRKEGVETVEAIHREETAAREQIKENIKGLHQVEEVAWITSEFKKKRADTGKENRHEKPELTSCLRQEAGSRRKTRAERRPCTRSVQHKMLLSLHLEEKGILLRDTGGLAPEKLKQGTWLEGPQI